MSPDLIPLAIALPLGSAAFLAGAGRFIPSALRDALSVAAAAGTATVTGLLLAGTVGHTRVYWFSGWRPVHGVVLGVDYVVDPVSAGFALLASVLATAALLYSRDFFDRMGGQYPALVLVFTAASIDFSLSGDLFNMFIAFELVAITAIVLTGFFAEREAPLQGAINLAVTSTVATLLFVLAIALLYDRTGTLNLASMGEALAGHRAGAAAVVALTLLTAAFLTKAAIVPFHFWLPDAYGTAPVPACVLFAGVMSELGVFGLARVWYLVYSGVAVPGGAARLGLVFCVVGAVTALVGAAMTVVQRRLRRLLGFVTVAHSGLYVLGFGLLSPASLAGVGVLLVADGFTKASLFLAAGVAARHTDEPAVARARPEAARAPAAVASLVLLAAGAVILSDLPPFGSGAGKDLLVAAAGTGGPAIEAVVGTAVTVSGGAILASVARRYGALRAAARAAGGGQGSEDGEPSEEESRAEGSPGGAARLLVTSAGLLLAALAVGLLPHLDRATVEAMGRFTDRGLVDGAVSGHPLAGVVVPVPPVPASATAVDVVEVLATLAFAACCVAPWATVARLRQALATGTRWLRRLHSGHVADQVTWQTVGTAAAAAVIGLLLR